MKFKQQNALWQFAGFAGVSLVGTLLHFLYDWTGGNPVAALFSGVNESTWEHIKLLFFPLLLLAVTEYTCIGKERRDFWCIKLRGILLGLLLIPTLFYTLQGCFGKTPDWINIAIFFVSAAISLWYETHAFQKSDAPCKSAIWCFALLCLIAVAFWVFTFFPPSLPLFRDPVDGSFGI